MKDQDEQYHSELIHFVQCSLIALKQEKPMAGLQENVFLCKWIDKARTQKRFHKIIAKDVQLLLNYGRHKGGLKNNLRVNLEHILQQYNELIELNN